jgi:ankyrin repeat protein
VKITLSGLALAYDSRSNEEIRDTPKLRSLAGLRYEDDLCANYLDKEVLDDISISGGAIAIAYDEDNRELRVVSEFWAPRELNELELNALIDDTQGQWSDGIGEACLDEWQEMSGIHIDLTPLGQNRPGGIVAQQVEDGALLPTYAHLPKAYWKGKIDLVQQAVRERADLNSLYDGFTTLGLALQKEDSQIAFMLIEGGADVNLSAPLVQCAYLRDSVEGAKIAHLLISRGASVNAKDVFGRTPLQAARERQRKELIELLVEAGAND